MKHAVIITENKYPCEDAGAIRQHATAKILKELGYSVIVLGYGTPTNGKVKVYEGIKYISFRPKSNNKFVRAICRATASDRMMSFLKRNCKNADIILVADVFANTVQKLNKLYNCKNTLLIHDSVEWFSPEQFAKGEKSFAYKTRNEINTKLVKEGWRVIAISSYLEEHFSKQCDKSVRIPVIMDVKSIKCNLDVDGSKNKIKFAYVGGPGKKDYLKNVIEGFELLPEKMLEKVELHIVGVTSEQLASVCDVKESSIIKLKGVLFAHGRVPHEEAIRFVREAGYTVLLRDASLKYAKAGFPTKVVESLSCGTPVICNLSSDLGLYLNDGENAFLAEDHMPESLKTSLENAITASPEQRKVMRINARKTAEEHFDYKNYTSVFSELINN